MKTVTVIKSGVSQKGGNWSLVEATIGNFKMSAFLRPLKPLAEGDIEIPSEVYKALQFKA